MARSSALSAELAWTIQLVHPVAVGGRFYRAWCLGVAFCLSYSLLFVTLHFVMGMKLVHPYSVLSPPCAVQHCTPLSRQVAALQCSRDGLRLPTSMQVYANLSGRFSAPVRFRLRCSVLHKSCLRMFQSHFWLAASRSVMGRDKAIRAQCCPCLSCSTLHPL